MLFPPAYAQSPAGGGTDIMLQILPLLLIFVVFYFLLIRPQQKKIKQHRSMVSALGRGDEVLTQGGAVGKITRLLDGEFIEIEIAPGVEVRYLRTSIQKVLENQPKRKATSAKKAKKSAGKKA